MAEPRVEQQPPLLHAMLVADYVHQDSQTGKFTILGTHNQVRSSGFPARHGPFCVFVTLTEVYGPTPIRVVIIDADEERPPVIETAEQVIDIPDPLVVVNVIFRITAAIFPGPGEYRVQLHAAGGILHERRFTVLPASGAQQS